MFEDHYLHTITTDFNNYNMIKSSQQSILDFPGEEINNFDASSRCIYFRTFI
jgi:hypothetical protein